MAYLKVNSVPAQQEMEGARACAIIQRKSIEFSSKNKKSYPIKSFLPIDKGEEISFFKDRHFGRG